MAGPALSEPAKPQVVPATVPAENDDTAELPVLRLPMSARKKALIGSGIALAVIGLAGYVFLGRPIAVRTQAAEEIREAVSGVGASEVIVDLDKKGQLRLSGSVQGEDQRAAVLKIVREGSGFANPVDDMTVVPTPSDIEGRVASALAAKWQSKFSVSIGPDFEAKLLGSADNEQQRREVMAFVGAQPGVAHVRDATSKSLDWRRLELQQFIDARRWRFVRGAVRDDGAIVLTGIVASANDRGRVVAATREAFPGTNVVSELVIWSAPVRRTSKN